ncbi:hypothetical protein E4T56_gene19471 [Termitomyces sp. T112]|nr:hypothetical protein E4T56_gene19471 [Termitomyces sp. T112]
METKVAETKQTSVSWGDAGWDGGSEFNVQLSFSSVSGTDPTDSSHPRSRFEEILVHGLVSRMGFVELTLNSHSLHNNCEKYSTSQMPFAFTSLPTEIILHIYNEIWVRKPIRSTVTLNDFEDIIHMSETCSRLRVIACSLLFREASNWKNGSYTGGAWPSAVWPYIRVVTVYDYEPKTMPRKLFDPADLRVTLPNLANVNHIRLEFIHDAPDLLSVSTLPFLFTMTALPHLETLSLRQSRFDGPSLTRPIAQMYHLTSLILISPLIMIQRLELKQYNRFEELKNVAEILQTVAPVLTKLEISGDLVDFQMFESTEWPNLSTFRLVDHVPYSFFRPITAVVAHMPMLQTLACDFKAEETPRTSFIFCPPDDHAHPPLSTSIPNLISLSLSNLQPGDQSVQQLPSGLRVLRVVALRDPHIHSIGNLKREPRYNYSALSDDDAYLWINAASKLPYLSRLTLHLKSVPSPELLWHIARACPQLEFLELEQASFEHNWNESPDSMLDLLLSPLASLSQLKELRMSVELGPALVWIETALERLPSRAFKARVQTSLNSLRVYILTRTYDNVVNPEQTSQAL